MFVFARFNVPFYNELVFSQRRKKPSFSKMIPFSGFSLSWMDDLYRCINWATASNVEDDCPIVNWVRKRVKK